MMREPRLHGLPSGSDPGRREFGAYGLWATSALLLGGTAAGAFYLYSQPADPAQACLSGDAKAHTLLLIDATDPLSDVHRRRVRTTATDAGGALAAGGRLTMLMLNPASVGEPRELLSICSPGRPDSHNGLVETPRRAEERWNTEFLAPLRSALEQALVFGEATNSPIVATLAALRQRPDFDSRRRELKLIIISDMVEVTPAYSQLRAGDLWRGYATSALPRTAPLDLRGITIAIDYLLRPQYATLQGTAHRRFWHRLLTEAGAEDVSFIGIAERPAAPVGSGLTSGLASDGRRR